MISKLQRNFWRLPWLAADRAKLACMMRYYRTIAQIGPGSRILNDGRIENPRLDPDLIRIGSDCTVRGELFASNGGSVTLGDQTYVGPYSFVWGWDPAGLKIGNRVLISHRVDIMDTDAHSLNPIARNVHYLHIVKVGHPTTVPLVETRPIVIEDDAWIGHSATISKGVRIGRGAMVAAKSLILQDVEPMTVVGGSPARVLRRINQIKDQLDALESMTEASDFAARRRALLS